MVKCENDNNEEADFPQEKNYIESYDLDQATGVKNVTSSIVNCIKYKHPSVDTRIYADNVRIGGTGGGPLTVNVKENPKERITWIKITTQPVSSRSIMGVEIHYLEFKDVRIYKPNYYKCRLEKGESCEYYFK